MKCPILMLRAALWVGTVANVACTKTAEEPPPSHVRVHVRVTSGQGQPVSGARVEYDGKAHFSDQNGVAEFELLSVARDRSVVAACPDDYEGASQTRHWPSSVLSSAQTLSMNLRCDPLNRRLALALYSECEHAEFFVGVQSIGTTKDGWFHGRVALPWSDEAAEQRGPELSLIARSLDSDCQFDDAHTKGGVAELELSYPLSETTQAVWAKFPRRPPRVAYRPRPKQTAILHRPERL